MGFKSIEEIARPDLSMVNRKTNSEMANRVYLLENKSDVPTSSRLFVLIDLLGCSDEKTMSGFMIHVIANVGDKLCPCTTSLSTKQWTYPREKLNVIYIGNLVDSVYLSNPNMIPSYLLLHTPNNVFQQIVSSTVSINIRFSLINILADNVYSELLFNNNNHERWTSTLNCQQFARLFVIIGLGLKWPDTITTIAGDHLPLIIDFGTMFISVKENVKSKIENGS